MPPSPTLDPSALEAGSMEAKFLGLIQFFDDLTGAEDWATSSAKIGIASVIVLTIVHKVVEKSFDVNWCSFFHAFVVGLMSFVASWLNIFAAEALTGTPEPLGGVLCKGPLTTWHSIVPAITMGYGIFDLKEGILMGKPDFIMHGVATLTIMSYFCWYGVPEIIMPMLLMEISTINLVFMGATKHMSELANLVNVIVFSLSFTIFRMIVCPKLWWDIWIATWKNRDNPDSQACLPRHFTYVVFVFGMFFNCLNTFWMIKIVQKLRRKISGTEKWKTKNHAKES